MLDNMIKNCIDRVDPQRKFSKPYVEQLRNKDRAKYGLPVASRNTPLYPEGYQTARRQLPEDVGIPPIGQNGGEATPPPFHYRPISSKPGGSRSAAVNPQPIGNKNINTNRPAPVDTQSSQDLPQPEPPVRGFRLPTAKSNSNSDTWNPTGTRTSVGLDTMQRDRDARLARQEAQNARLRQLKSSRLNRPTVSQRGQETKSKPVTEEKEDDISI